MLNHSAVVSIESILFVAHKFNNEHNNFSIIVHFRYRSAGATFEEFFAPSKATINLCCSSSASTAPGAPEILITVSWLCDISPGMLRETGTLWPQSCFTARANSAVMNPPPRLSVRPTVTPSPFTPPFSCMSGNKVTKHTCMKPSQYISMQEGSLPSACIKTAWLVSHVMDCLTLTSLFEVY